MTITRICKGIAMTGVVPGFAFSEYRFLTPLLLFVGLSILFHPLFDPNLEEDPGPLPYDKPGPFLVACLFFFLLGNAIGQFADLQVWALWIVWACLSYAGYGIMNV